MPLEINMIMRPLVKSIEFDPLGFFIDCAKHVSLEFTKRQPQDDLFLETLTLAVELKKKHEGVVFWEGFGLTDKRIAKRHFWIAVGNRHISLANENSIFMETWGVPIPELALALCTMSAAITTSNGCIGVINSLPENEQKELAWLLYEPHNQKTPVTF